MMEAYFTSSVCVNCLRLQRLRLSSARNAQLASRRFSNAVLARSQHESAVKKSKSESEEEAGECRNDTEQGGAMSRRLAEMTEESMAEGGKSARRNMQNAGFSDELKAKLEERIAASNFKSENAAAFSIANMPASAGRGTREMAAGTPWTGTESIYDSSLRMLDDASKPMRVPFRPPNPSPVDLKPEPKPRLTPGERLASAKHRTSTYEHSQDPTLSDKEREAVRRELKERFTPAARGMPMSIQGLNSLANELIEDAIAQGKFRNVKRGKGVGVKDEHPTTFLDTTEVLLNRIIQRQEVVPPWIEKQQELAKEVEKFRTRLRNDWRRQAARVIASQGGSLQEQMRRAKAYAAAEARQSQINGKRANESTDTRTHEWKTQIDAEGRLSRISQPTSSVEASSLSSEAQRDSGDPSGAQSNTAATAEEEEPLPNLPPLRDPQYLATENAYHNLTIKTLNTLTRSYNLLAPQAAHKPYLNLERELNACYADVAPSLAAEIHRRATEKAHNRSGAGAQHGSEGSLLDRLAPKQNIRLHEEDASKRYGFKEFWRDLWS